MPDSIVNALRGLGDGQGFIEAVRKAVILGGDADTIDAVCGQLAGAYPGSFDQLSLRSAGIDILRN